MTHFVHQNNFWLIQYATGYHSGLVAPPGADGASFVITCQEFAIIFSVFFKNANVQLNLERTFQHRRDLCHNCT